jgi:hypothetical protein
MLSGCSLIAVDGPPKHQSPRSKPCTNSYVAPVIDTLIASGAAIGTYEVATYSKTGSTGEGFMKIYALPPLILTTLIFGYSALDGYSTVGACNAVRHVATPPSRDLDP